MQRERQTPTSGRHLTSRSLVPARGSPSTEANPSAGPVRSGRREGRLLVTPGGRTAWEAPGPAGVRLGGRVGDVDRHSLHYVVLTAQGLGDLPDNNRQICYLLIILIGPHGQYQADNCLE